MEKANINNLGFWERLNPEQMKDLESKRKILSSLAYFIGKDFNLPVNFGEPGSGWSWDFQQNTISIDPVDVLEKPLDYLRFVISHEGGHRRLSKTDFIDQNLWQKTGFSMMMNAIEDPRVNNAVAEFYPAFREQMIFSIEDDLQRVKSKRSEILSGRGFVPMFMHAAMEYINLWYASFLSREQVVDPELPELVQEVIKKTYDAAEVSWWTYPTKSEADASEALIRDYSKASYEINRDRVWPEFQRLIQEDVDSSKIAEIIKKLLEFLERAFDEAGESTKKRPDAGTELTPQQADELSKILKKANMQLPDAPESQKEEEAQGATIQMPNIDNLPPETKAEIRDFIEKLPENIQNEIREKAQTSLQEVEAMVMEVMEHEIEQKEQDSTNKSKEADVKMSKKVGKNKQKTMTKKETMDLVEQQEIKKLRQAIERMFESSTRYEEYQEKVLPIIDRLENDLRQIFRARRHNRWEGGKRSGPNISLSRRISEIGQGISAFDSRAWQKRELPSEKDYAITLLTDLSGSMQGEKINETFKAVIVLSEVLNRLSIKVEILGFNDHLHEYQGFDEKMSDQVRNRLPGMLGEVHTDSASWNDDGWALLEASSRLGKRIEAEKFLIVLSDGCPVPSWEHRGSQYELSKVIAKIRKETKQKLIGLGIGEETRHVERYYPNHLAEIGVEEMADKLSKIIKEVINEGEKYK